MMNWDVMLYRAAMIHDLKKCLLNRDVAKRTQYGSWAPEHLRWDDLSSQGPMDDLRGLPKAQERLSPEMLTLIKLHQRVSHKKLGLNDSDVNQLDTLTVVSLMAADSLHKALYYGDDYKVGEGEIGLSKQFPFYYPFYGKPRVWLADEKKRLDTFPGVSPNSIENVVEFGNARTTIFGQAWKKLFSSLPWTPKQLVKLNEDYLASFPDTTYLPVTSLNFHHRFVAAISLLLKQDLAEVTFPAGRRGRRDKNVDLEWALCTITTPPERLTNRLRDTTIVRKISHLLQHRLHAALKKLYLSTMTELDFSHPDTNPFFFYNKDAIVLICRKSDLKEIEECCKSVAEETESVLTMETLQIKAFLTLAVKLGETTTDTGWSQLKVSDLFRDNNYDISASADYAEPEYQHFWGSSPVPPKLQAQTPQEAKHCYHCNKVVTSKEIRVVQQEDELCENCYRLYDEYAYCLDCRVYFKKSEDDQRKLHNRHSQRSSLTPLLLQGKGKNKTHRVAYIFVQTSASYSAFRQQRQAPEVMLARFRHHRYLFEQRETDGEKEELLNQLARVEPTRFGIFEYLQAALNMSQFQNELEGCLEESLKWLRDKQKLRLAKEAKEYTVQPEDFSKAGVTLLFLYRSPTQTLMVVPEAALAHFYRQLETKLSSLKLSHRVRIVTCDHNHPVWMVLRQLGIPEEFEGISDNMAKRLKELQQEQKKFSDFYDKTLPLLKEPARELGVFTSRLDNLSRNLTDAKKAALFQQYQDSLRKLDTPLALYLERGKVQRLLNACFKQPELQQKWKKDLDQMRVSLESVATQHQAEIENQLQAMHALYERGRELYEQFDAEQRQGNERLEWFILRGGNQRRLKGYWARYLLLDWHPRERIASQFGHLSEFASRWLTHPPEDTLADEYSKRFYAHLFLELESRVYDRHEKGRERIPKKLADDIQNGLSQHPPLPPNEVPGLLRELAARQQVDAGLQAASLQKRQRRRGGGRNVQSRGSNRYSRTRRRSSRR